MSAVDAFMMIPLCAEVRKMSHFRRGFHRSKISVLDNKNSRKLQKQSKKRKLKMFRMLKRIMKPQYVYLNSRNETTFPSSRRHKKNHFNRFFNRRLRRVLRKLFRKRKEKLIKEQFSPRGRLSHMYYRRRARRAKVINSIRKYKLNRIFKLFKIRIYNPRFTNSTHASYMEMPKTTPILCIAAKKISNHYKNRLSAV